MRYNRCGESGLKLSELTLGFWHNFGEGTSLRQCGEMFLTAFDAGITSFDLADNYGPPPGAAESLFGEWLHRNFLNHRDEIVIATKAGHEMWNGVYGIGGSRKHLIAGLEQSLNRLKLDYVDVFYHHCPDPDTPVEETWQAIADIVKSGKALYAGFSKYSAADAEKAVKFFKERNVPCILNQQRYNLFQRDIETEILPTSEKCGVGVSVFSVLAQGLLSDKYLDGIPSDSRVARGSKFLRPESLTAEKLSKIKSLNHFAKLHGVRLVQLALRWALRSSAVTTAVIGASRPEQILDNVKTLDLDLPADSFENL